MLTGPVTCNILLKNAWPVSQHTKKLVAQLILNRFARSWYPNSSLFNGFSCASLTKENGQKLTPKCCKMPVLSTYSSPISSWPQISLQSSQGQPRMTEIIYYEFTVQICAEFLLNVPVSGMPETLIPTQFLWGSHCNKLFQSFWAALGSFAMRSEVRKKWGRSMCSRPAFCDISGSVFDHLFLLNFNTESRWKAMDLDTKVTRNGWVLTELRVFLSQIVERPVTHFSAGCYMSREL